MQDVHAFSPGAAAAKRLFDLFGATVLLSGCAPLLVVIALIVRLQDGGPALFRQQRLGLQGSTITVLKFRSMRVAASSDLQAPQARLDDPRITPSRQARYHRACPGPRAARGAPRGSRHGFTGTR